MGVVRSGRDVDTALCKKGFRREVDGNHVCYEYPGSDVQTKISHGMQGRDIGRELLGKMAKQTHLKFNHFLALIDCSMDKEAYRASLLEQGQIHVAAIQETSIAHKGTK